MTTFWTLSILLAQVASPPAAADLETGATALVEQAAHQYDQGLLDEALRTLTRAQAMSRRPSILYNIAQVHRARKDCGAALAAYQAFLAETSDGDPNRRRALRWRGEMQTCVDLSAGAGDTIGRAPAGATAASAGGPSVLAAGTLAGKQRDLGSAQAPALAKGAPARPVSHTTAAPGMVLTVSSAPPADDSARRQQTARKIGWSLLGAGALAGGAAAVLAWQAARLEPRVSSGGIFDAATYDEGNRDARWARWLALSAAGVAAGGGALLILYRVPATEPRAGRSVDTAGLTTALVGWWGIF